MFKFRYQVIQIYGSFHSHKTNQVLLVLNMFPKLSFGTKEYFKQRDNNGN